MKNKIFLKYIIIQSILLLGTILLVVTPLWMVDEWLGKSLMLGLPPMLLMALSWMAGAWWAFDKGQGVFMAVTVGATPIRMLMGLLWAAMVIRIPGIHEMAFAVGMMIFWAMFTATEIGMVVKLSHLPSSTEVEPEEG